MDAKQARYASVSGWLCVGLSILMLALYAVKSLTDRDVSPALPIIGIVVLSIGITGLARAKKASQQE